MEETDHQEVGVLTSRLSYFFVSFGFGLSLLSQPYVTTPGLTFIREQLHLPLQAWGSVFILLSVLLLVATVKDNGYWVEKMMLVHAAAWGILSLAFIPPVFIHFESAPFAGAVLLSFVCMRCISGSTVELQRRKGLGPYRPRIEFTDIATLIRAHQEERDHDL